MVTEQVQVSLLCSKQASDFTVAHNVYNNTLELPVSPAPDANAQAAHFDSCKPQGLDHTARS